MKTTLRSLLLALGVAVPFSALAYDPYRWQVSSAFGPAASVDTIIAAFINVLTIWLVPFAITAFLIGAFWMVLFAHSDESAGKGKKIMIGAVFGLAVATLSFAMLRLVVNFIYGS
jgi:hypothetical protein